MNGNHRPSRSPLRALGAAALIALALSPAARAAETADPAWASYQDGRRLYDERRFGEALEAFKRASELSAARFAEAVRRIDAAVAELRPAGASETSPSPAGEKKPSAARDDSLSSLVDALAERDLIPQDLEAIKVRAGASLQKRVALLKARRLSFTLSGLLDAVDTVLGRAGSASFGNSISALRSRALLLREYPEAEYWIGRIFLGEGETRLAELQFKRAYEARAALEVPDEVYPILESLAEVYRDQGRMREYEQSLLEIAGSSELFSKGRENLRSAMERSIARDGMDAFMSLYRIGEEYPRRAFSALGAFYLGNGRPIAAIYLAAAANIVLTKAVIAVRSADPSYSYAGLADLLTRIEADRSAAKAAAEAGLYRDLILLGESLSANGYRESARGVWGAVASRSRPEPWRRMAAEALARSPAGAAATAP